MSIIIDVLLFVGGCVILALPLWIAYGIKHEDPMKVFESLSEKDLTNEAEQYEKEGLLEIPQEEENGNKNESNK